MVEMARTSVVHTVYHQINPVTQVQPPSDHRPQTTEDWAYMLDLHTGCTALQQRSGQIHCTLHSQ